MIRLGLRLVITGGREALIRLFVLIFAVGLGVGLLLVAISGTNAVNTQNARYAWLFTGPGMASSAGHAPLWWLLRADYYQGQLIGRVDVAATGPTSPVPPGMSGLPGPGQYYASPAMERLLASAPAGQLADRYPGRLAGTIGNAALPSPDTLAIVIGHPAAQMAHQPGADEVTAIDTTTPSSCHGSECELQVGIDSNGIDLIMSVVALAILFPVLIFIATATRLSAARREQRFAAMRLAGAAPRQISVIAAVESTVASIAGTGLGFGLFFLLRIPLANVPFTGAPFFVSDLSLSTVQVLIVALGVPVAAAVAARLALRRVHISPLGVTRRVTPKPPRAWRVVPLLAGLAELGFWVVDGRHHLRTTPEQIQAFLPGFVLVLAGLMLAGPWLTMTGARLLATRTARPGTLIAARRLADDPRGAFRAVSGLVLALYVTTVAVAMITTTDARQAQLNSVAIGPGAASIVTAQFTNDPPAGAALAPSDALIGQLRSVSGVQAVVVVYQDGSKYLPVSLLGPYGRSATAGPPAGVVSCAELAKVPDLGRCPAGAAAVLFPAPGTGYQALARLTWPVTSAAGLDSHQALGLSVATNGSTAAVERTSTVLENAYPWLPWLPGTAAAAGQINQADRQNKQYQQLADVVILVSLPIAGCTLAASITAGLADRRKPFSLLRLTGAPLRMLQRVLALESAVPLLVVAVVAIGAGFGSTAMFTAVEYGWPLAAPGAAYYLITAAGIVLALGIIAATLPLLRRLTGPDIARNE
jgi:hypothetical protein